MSGTRAALIIGISEYSDAGLRQLRTPTADARAVEAVLSDPNIGAFEVSVLLDEPHYTVGPAVEEFFSERTPEDMLVLYFSGHGQTNKNGQLYFCMTNTKLRLLESTAVPASFVDSLMGGCLSRRVILLLDCCYSGAFGAKASTDMRIEDQFHAGRGFAVLTASTKSEYAFERGELAEPNDLGRSVFTSALVEGLQTGDADRDQDGWVGLDELYEYIYEKVRSVTPYQTPTKSYHDVRGDIVIARRSRPVMWPAPLPAGLQEVLNSSFSSVRAAVVPHLQLLLHSKHQGLALAARQALVELTGDDSRMVSEAATEALKTELSDCLEVSKGHPCRLQRTSTQHFRILKESTLSRRSGMCRGRASPPIHQLNQPRSTPRSSTAKKPTYRKQRS